MTRREAEVPCRWGGSERGWLMPEHVRDCDAAGCPGCKPCAKTHCAMRGSCPNHVDEAAGVRTCASCIGSARRDLSRIGDLYALADTVVESRANESAVLLDEAEQDGVEAEAFNLIGPAAAPEQYAEHRRRLGIAYEQRGWCDWPRHERYREDDPHHPYAVLGRWDLALREQYGPQTDLFITVASAIGYLTNLLAGSFPHDDEFEDFVHDIARCRSHLEAVIHDSRAPEVGRPCPRCVEVDEAGKGPRLQKRYAVHPKLKRGERCARPPRTESEPNGCRTCAGEFDTWHCPVDATHWWSEEDYRLRVASDYLEHASALTADQLGERLGVKPGTIRVWANRGQVRKRGRDHLGRQLYDVADATRRSLGSGESAAHEPSTV